jgi:copper transport protein
MGHGVTNQRRLLAWAVAGVVALWPTLLWAHARLTSSEPAAMSALATAPSVIRLWFSEAPELALSAVTLKDSAGVAVALGPIQSDTSNLGIRASIDSALPAGRYTIGWRIAGKDGHPITGSYSFVVLAAGALSPDSARADTAPRSQAASNDVADAVATTESIGYVLSRFVTFVALLMLVGVVVFKLGVLDQVGDVGDKTRLEATRSLARLAGAAAIVLAMAAAARLQLQQELFTDPSHLVHLQTIAANTEWGRAWILQVASAVILAAATWVGRRGYRAPWMVAAAAAVPLAFSPALGGHAAAAADSRGIAIAADGLHVLGAAGWLGGLACLLFVGLPAAVHAAEGRWRAVASLVSAFSPVALTCTGIVLLTGVVSVWLRLGAFAPLWTTGYGRVLLVKLALLVGVAGTGAYNWLRVKPTLGTATATARLRKSAAVELAVGIAVIIATAVLVALPTPFDPPQ